MARKAAKEPPSGRPSRQRARRKRRLVVCGGKVTEPGYFGLLREGLGIAGTVTVSSGGAGKDPLSLVRHAKRLAQAEERGGDHDPYASVWVVTDADEFADSLRKAQAEADACPSRLGLSLVISNPCFEVWLVDHVRACPDSCAETAACESYAIAAGVLESTSHDRKSARRFKQVREEAVRGRWDDALRNAGRHNTGDKREARSRDAGQTGRYAVWTDMPDVVRTLIEDARGLAR